MQQKARLTAFFGNVNENKLTGKVVLMTKTYYQPLGANEMP